MGILDGLFGRSKTTEMEQDTKSKSESSSQSTIHPLLRKMGRDMLGQGQALAATPYMPNRGLRYAAFTPGQEGAMGMANQMLASMGFSPQDFLGTMPQAEQMGGMTGYTVNDLYDETMAATDPDNIYQSLLQQKLAELGKMRQGGGNQAPQQQEVQPGNSVRNATGAMMDIDPAKVSGHNMLEYLFNNSKYGG